MFKHTVNVKVAMIVKVKYDTNEDKKGALLAIQDSTYCSCISAGDDGENFDIKLMRVDIPKKKGKKYEGSKQNKGKSKRSTKGKRRTKKESGEAKVGIDGQGN